MKQHAETILDDYKNIRKLNVCDEKCVHSVACQRSEHVKGQRIKLGSSTLPI